MLDDCYGSSVGGWRLLAQFAVRPRSGYTIVISSRVSGYSPNHSSMLVLWSCTSARCMFVVWDVRERPCLALP